MKKWIKIVLVSSISLNLILVVSLFLLRMFAVSAIWNLLAISSRADLSQLEHIASKLDPNDPAGIIDLKQNLNKRIELQIRVTEMHEKIASEHRFFGMFSASDK